MNKSLHVLDDTKPLLAFSFLEWNNASFLGGIHWTHHHLCFHIFMLILHKFFSFFFNKKKKEKRKINDCCRAQTKKIDSDRMGPLIKLICCNSQHNFNSNHPCVIILCIIVVPRNTLVIFEDDSPLTKVKRALQIIINLCW